MCTSLHVPDLCGHGRLCSTELPHVPSLSGIDRHRLAGLQQTARSSTILFIEFINPPPPLQLSWKDVLFKHSTLLIVSSCTLCPLDDLGLSRCTQLENVRCCENSMGTLDSRTSSETLQSLVCSMCPVLEELHGIGCCRMSHSACRLA